MDSQENSVSLSRKHYNVRYPYTRENEKAMRGLEQQVSNMFDLAHETPETTQGKTCLELGCGTGEETFLLVKKYGLQVTAIELNESSLVLARKLMEDYNFTDKVTFLNQDLHSFDLGSNVQFDFVLSKGVIHHLHTPSRAVLKALSHLRPGGKCMFRVNWLYGWMFKKDTLVNFAMLKLLNIFIPDRGKRMSVGERWFYNRRSKGGGLEKQLVIEDIFGSVYKPMRLVTFLKWFKQTGVIYRNSYPNHALKSLLEIDYKFSRPREGERLARKIVRLLVLKTGLADLFRSSSFLSRTLVQFLYMFILRNQLTLIVIGQKKTEEEVT